MFMAGTIRVVIAAKLLKKLILHTLIYSVYLVLKLLPVPVPAQGRLAFKVASIPELDSAVKASTCYVCAVWAPCDGQDPAFAMRLVSTRTTQPKEANETTKLKKKKCYQFECPFKRRQKKNLGIGLSKKKILPV
jgi:hypothetical protein